MEWTSQTDARLDWLDAATWQCGLGGCFYGKLWQFILPDFWKMGDNTQVDLRTIMTIPLAEFVAMVGGVSIAQIAVPDADHVVLEVDASATPTALITKADSDRLRVAHEVFMESDFWTWIEKRGLTRQIWGDANTCGDACSRGENDTAENFCRLLGQKPHWVELPQNFFVYFTEVVKRLHALGLPPPATAMKRRKRVHFNGDMAPNQTAACQAP